METVLLKRYAKYHGVDLGERDGAHAIGYLGAILRCKVNRLTRLAIESCENWHGSRSRRCCGDALTRRQRLTPRLLHPLIARTQRRVRCEPLRIRREDPVRDGRYRPCRSGPLPLRRRAPSSNASSARDRRMAIRD